jgi:thioredoxin 1
MAKQFNATSFDEALKGSAPVLVDFWATWCGPCRIMGPVIEEVATEFEGRAVVGKVDVDEEGALAQRYGIMSIPTLILFKNGQPVDKRVGVTPKAEVVKMLNAVL